ncbi:hypothetical protein V8D89_005266 [Ganoderma adspersum]
MSTPDTIPPPDDDAPWESLPFERDRLRSEEWTVGSRAFPSASEETSRSVAAAQSPTQVPDDRPPRRRRVGGVQTPEYVYDPVPGSSQPDIDIDEPKSIVSGSALSDDYVECFTEPETQSEVTPVESEIENATESWTAGMRSEIEDFTSDEE